jgi:aspartate kinase
MNAPLVMKFGGTSVADAGAIADVVSLVARAREDVGALPIVVVSAMAGVTDALLALADGAEKRRDPAAGIDALRRRHIDALRALVPAPAGHRLEQQLAAHINDLRALLDSAAILCSTTPAARDAIAATGELMNSRIVAAALEAAAVPAAWVDARSVIVTDRHHGHAAPLATETERAACQGIRPWLERARVPVIGGFVGATPEGVTTTLGRGGSDFTAALIGAALTASEIQIWTDVDGMLTADPRTVSDARVVPSLSFGEASELAYFGAKVLHPSTILPAATRGIPVRILNTRRPGSAGTLIVDRPPDDPRSVAAVACKRDVTTIEITSTRMLMAYGFLSRVFEIFERFRTPVDVVTTSEVSVSVTVDTDERLADISRALGEIAEVRVERDMAILSAVGDNLRRDARIAARVIGALGSVDVRMVSQAASRRNVTIVVRGADAAVAMARLHEEFFGHESHPHRPGPDGAADRVALS